MYRDITGRKSTEYAMRAFSGLLLEVQETERRQLAHELHDEIGQMLTCLRLLLRAGGDSVAGAAEAQIEQARNIVDDLLAKVRRFSFDLRPAELDKLGLLPALIGLFARYTAQCGIQVDFKHQSSERRFASDTETGAYRIVQEALTNAARHARVTGVTVRVWIASDMLKIQIEDRGCGFDPDAALNKADFGGLAGMQERVRLLSGYMTIESSPGTGTTITAELPVGRAAAA